MCRLKVFQLAGIAALAVPINTFLATGNVESTQVGRLLPRAAKACQGLWLRCCVACLVQWRKRCPLARCCFVAALGCWLHLALSCASPPLAQVVMATGLVVGAGVASTTLWYYSRRYLGEMSLLPSSAAGQPPRLRLSVLDFWGNREVCCLGWWWGDCACGWAGGARECSGGQASRVE